MIKNQVAASSDYIAIAKEVAASINRDCYNRSMKSQRDRRVLLLIGLTPALDAAAKEAGYRSEILVMLIWLWLS